MPTIDIRKLSAEQLKNAMVTLGEKPFRAKQVHEWLWKRSAMSFEEMTNLSKELRTKLESEFMIRPMVEDISQKSKDGTIKIRYQLHDGNMIEGVLIPVEGRVTACVSSQVGCSLSCKFCATGFMGRKRNLDPAEIYDQIVLLNRRSMEAYDMPLSNVVFMGMGEPLLNYANVMQGIDYVISPDGLNMSAKRITVSTAGIAKMIHKMGDDGVRFNLALSLHAANDTKRNIIMAINETNNLQALVVALNYFYEKTGGRITFEYILFDKFNDSRTDAEELVKLCRKVPGAKVNIIEYNNVDQVPYTKTGETRRDEFIHYLESNDVVANVRLSRGKDIDAACGQLANKA
ncbi:23S rRNA (adenine(2503)-C(2))-methyltransferase RlmN [soil metagenome]